MPPSPEKDVLLINCRLYGLHQIEEQAGAFLKCASTPLFPYLMSILDVHRLTATSIPVLARRLLQALADGRD